MDKSSDPVYNKLRSLRQKFVDTNTVTGRAIAAEKQPKPTGEGTAVYPLVLQDICTRVTMGKKKHGVLLRTNNGRNPLIDAYQEALDLVMYLRQAIEEANG